MLLLLGAELCLELGDVLWYLDTRDAQGIYARAGFVLADPGRTMVRPRRERSPVPGDRTAGRGGVSPPPGG